MTEFIARDYAQKEFEVLIKTDSKEHYNECVKFARSLVDRACRTEKRGEAMGKKIIVNDRKYYIHIPFSLDGINLIYEDGVLVGWYRP